MNKEILRRKGFDSNALLYNAIRPRYSAKVFETIAGMTNLAKNSKLLEIGPGTGQATKYFAENGYDITAVELGANLAVLARKELASFPKANVITGSFEEVKLPRASFDLVFSATAFHWIKPEYKFKKTHALLKPRRYLAIIHTKHVSDEAGDTFSHAIQPIYNKYTSSSYKTEFRLERRSKLKPEEIDEVLFRLTFFNTFPLAISYTSDEYVKLLSTYSPTIAMKPAIRAKFLKAIKDKIDDNFGGEITKHYGITVTIAQAKVL